MDTKIPIGYLKYDGVGVQDGVIDALAGAKALEGFDAAIRYFAVQEKPELGEIDFPIPVRIEQGSWIAEIPAYAGTLMLTGFGVVAFSYLRKAAEKMAEKDFDGVGLSDVLRRSVRGVQWLIAVSKHLGHTNVRHAKLVWDKTDYVGIMNAQGATLYMPMRFLKPLAGAPVMLLSDIAGVVDEGRTLRLGVSEGEVIHEEIISKAERSIFSDDETDQEVLFPELVHGQYVELEGVVTRGNEMTNTIGFWYENHVINCRPRRGSIVKHKKQLFLNCRISGEISRLDKKGNPTEPRPKIIFDKLVALKEGNQMPLPMDENDEEQ